MKLPNKFKDLIVNVGLLTLGNFATKILSFFLVPLYTSILTTYEYGIYDIFHTTIILLIPVLTINIQEAVLRYSLNKESDKKNVLRIGLRFVNISIAFVTVFSLINYWFGVFSTLRDYTLLFVLLFSFSAINGVLSSFARGVSKVKDYTIASVISSAVTIVLNVWLLAFAGKGLEGYFIAYILGNVSSCAYLAIILKKHNYFGKIDIDEELQRSMITYSAPLIITAVGWWVNNASDRYIVTWLCGLATNGIYSVGYKVPYMLNVLQTIFNQAWVLSAVREFDPQDRDGFFAKTYSIYGAAILVACFVLNIFTRFIAAMLFKKSFYNAWIYTPFLNISILFGALSGVLVGVFYAVKDSKSLSIPPVVGAAINIVINILLVLKIGAIGAAISTAISYFAVWVIMMIRVRKHIELRLHLRRDILAYCVLLAQSVWLYLTNESILYYSFSFLLLGILIWLYRREAKMIFEKIKRKV